MGERFNSGELGSVAPQNHRVVVSSADAAARTLKKYERFVDCITSGSDLTLTLPPVAECQGLIFTIYFLTDGKKDVYVADNNDDAGFTTLKSVDATDFLVLISDGARWLVIGQSGFAD